MKEFPKIIKDVGFDFEFDFDRDPPKIWTLNTLVVEEPLDDFIWHLSIPFWSTPTGHYDLSPLELIRDPSLSEFHYNKVVNAELIYPIDFLLYKGRKKIIDGLHRLTKSYIRNEKTILARRIDLNDLLKTIKK